MDSAEEALSELADQIGRSVAGGDTVEGAVRRLQKFGVDLEMLRQARLMHERRVGIIRDLTDPMALVDDDIRLGYWYPGPHPDDVYWSALRGELETELPEEAWGPNDRSSTKILSLMRPPGTEEIHSRGLVLGYVQSGKTTNFMSVIAKAADVGYRLFVVLSGITDNLRSQTQERLEDQLVGSIRERWFLLTSLDEDFLNPGNAPNLLKRPDDRLLAVIKKNPYRLRRLVQWLNSASQQVLQNCPILMIDDEADQASIDVGKVRTSRINGLIRQILEKPKAAYVAYTATPFANLLVNPAPEDVYPRDFIVELLKAPDYFGAEKIFGRERFDSDEDDSVTDGLDVIRHVDPTELDDLRAPRTRGEIDGWQPEVTASLSEALDWFVLATAARRHRATGVRHSTMLIHTTMSARAHLKIAEPVRAHLASLERGWLERDTAVVARLRDLWSRETERLPPEDAGQTEVAWENVEHHLEEVLAEMKVVVDNYLSQERLSYAKGGPRVTAVVIGGNTLSRGLTLEGLVCSFFVRSASAYDTVLQMGRWFGYRSGYPDLVRIWMTDELEGWFFDLATVEEEIRREIRRYEAESERVTPIDLPVRIRCHDAMTITSAAKMRSAVRARISFSEAREQTILFNHRDSGWLATNIEATRCLIGSICADGIPPEQSRDGRSLFRDVPSKRIRDFLRSYLFHEKAYRMKPDLLTGYLDEQNGQGHLLRWSVVIMGHPTGVNGEIDLALPESIGLIVRSRLDMPNIPHANIKSLVSTVDRVADLEVPAEVLRKLELGGRPDDGRLATYREDVLGDVGLLCLYPISRNSKPRKRTKGEPTAGTLRRLPLEAVDDAIGVGIYFPKARGDVREFTYMTADLSGVHREPDDIDIDDIDAADEAAGEREEPQQPSGNARA